MKAAPILSDYALKELAVDAVQAWADSATVRQMVLDLKIPDWCIEDIDRYRGILYRWKLQSPTDHRDTITQIEQIALELSRQVLRAQAARKQP